MSSDNYRVYRLDGLGHLHDPEWFAAANDKDAIAQIKAKRPNDKCEIWSGSRLIQSLPSP